MKGRPKPLQGAKKYDRAKLNCTISGCDAEFYVSKSSTPAKRYCEDHWKARSEKPPQDAKLDKALALFKSYGLV